MGTGGSRWGAGRPGWRRKCEQVLSLDIRRLSKRGHLQPGTYSSQSWSWNGAPCGSISTAATSSALQLSYSRTRDEEEPRRYCYDVPLERTRCHFGGSRLWFRCPWCTRRCAVIYGLSSDGYFACRSCLRLGYSSECEGVIDRLNRRMRKFEARLDYGEVKPKWMRWRTFEHICEEMERLDAAWGLAVCAHLGISDLDLAK